MKLSGSSDIKIVQLPSEFYDSRPKQVAVDTIIIHSIYNPEIEDCFSVRDCKALLDKYEVSAHYLIDRTGIIYQLVADESRAWHAGASKMPNSQDGREGVNAFSLGIELIGSESSNFTADQYQAIAALAKRLIALHPIQNIYGHKDIAPDRKSDPWEFDWERFKSDLKEIKSFESINFP